MDTTPEDDAGAPGPAGPPDAEGEQYGTIEIGNGDVVIYDRDNPRAWLQSDAAVSLDA